LLQHLLQRAHSIGDVLSRKLCQVKLHIFPCKYGISLGNFLKHHGINLSDGKKLQEHFYQEFPQTPLRHAYYLLKALAPSYSHLVLLRFLKLQATVYIQVCNWA
jgi:hypothetical protein